jgi:hypothetical protein
MEDNEYPRFVCKPGNSEEAWGYMIDPGSATDAEELESMLADGWYLTPGEWDGEDAPKRRGRTPKDA